MAENELKDLIEGTIIESGGIVPKEQYLKIIEDNFRSHFAKRVNKERDFAIKALETVARLSKEDVVRDYAGAIISSLNEDIRQDKDALAAVEK